MDENRSISAVKYLWICFRLVGAYPPKKNRNLYYLITIPMNLIFMIYFNISFAIGISLLPSPKLILQHLSTFLPEFVMILKTFNMYLQHKKLMKIKLLADELDKYIKDQNEKDYIKRIIKNCHKFVFFCCGLYYSAWLSLEILFFVSGSQDQTYPSWYPFDPSATKLRFYLIHSFQAFAIAYQIIANLACDSFPPVYLYWLRGHFHILLMRIERIGEINKENSEKVYKELVDCVRCHEILCQIFDIQKIAISVNMLFQLTATGFILSIIAGYVMYADGGIFETISVIVLASAILNEILLACFFGTLLLAESEKLRDKIYSCNWVKQNKKFRKALIIFIQRSQLNMQINAGSMIPLTLEGFLSVMKFTYSAFVMLSQMKDRAGT